jgi:hypothetical protein
MPVLQVVTLGSLFKGPISAARGCDEEQCPLAPEIGLTNSDGTPSSVPLAYLTMALAYTVRTTLPHITNVKKYNTLKYYNIMFLIYNTI